MVAHDPRGYLLLGVVTVGLLLTAAPLAGGVGSNPLSGHAGQLRDELEVEGLDYAREEELEGLEEFGYDNGIGVVEDIEDKEERAPHDDVAQAMSPEEAKEFFTLENVAFSPTQLTLGDEEGGKVLFRASVTAKHGLAGAIGDPPLLYPSQAVFVTPSGKGQSAIILPDVHAVTGDAFRGTFETTMELPLWNSEEGVYQLSYVMLTDKLGNEAMFYSDEIPYHRDQQYGGFTVEGSRFDYEEPKLWGLSVATKRFESPSVGIPGKVVINLDIEETLSGLAGTLGDIYGDASYVRLRSQDAPAHQEVMVHFDGNNATVPPRAGDETAAEPGTAPIPAPATKHSRLFRLEAVMPVHAWPGGWEISHVRLSDRAGNSISWSALELQEAGFATTLFIGNRNLTYLGDDLYHYEERRYRPVDPYAEQADYDYGY